MFFGMFVTYLWNSMLSLHVVTMNVLLEAEKIHNFMAHRSYEKLRLSVLHIYSVYCDPTFIDRGYVCVSLF